MTGKVILVGAGPGGRDLLTLRGAEVLQSAEAVVYDRLVSPDILELIPQTAERVNVGKENNHHPVPQDQINEILVRLAQEGKQTVRLKGGDCYLFGRGGEECEYLLEHGISFEVVPGVTSALAVPAYAGIPVTHRDYCSSVHIVTAHARAGKPLDIHFDALVQTGGTLVFLMGLSALSEVMQGLLSAGMSPDMPAAVISNGARGNQKKVVATISTLYDAVRAAGLKSPALIVVGRVCELHSALDWFTPLPLHGKTIAVTRPKERIGTLSKKLRALGANVIECPCIETQEIEDTALLKYELTDRWDWVVLTSPAGVSAMVHALQRAGYDLRALYGMQFAVIGPGTAQALAAYGIEADLMPDVYDGAHLGQALVDTLDPKERVLILRSAQGGSELTAKLREAEITFADVATYETVYRTDQGDLLRTELANGTLDVVTFTSASTVRGFVEAVGDLDFQAFTALCIGQQTAAQAQSYGMQVKIAKTATIDSMIACLLEE